jgi:L-alanine-DL-glutamate epimerase-like enolase superfamily enzyme
MHAICILSTVFKAGSLHDLTDIATTILRLPKVLPNGDGLQDVLLIRVHTDEGIVGIGEAHTVPLVLKAVIDAPVSQLTGQGFKQMLIGKNPLDINVSVPNGPGLGIELNQEAIERYRWAP